jgi:hypothetical protein
VSIKTVVDRRRDIALVLLIAAAGSIWSWFHPTSVLPGSHPWFGISMTVVLIALSVGMWRASEWARWGCGLLSILSSVRLLLMFLSLVLKADVRGTSSGTTALIMVLFFSLFWAAVAFYCLRPTTGKLFAQIREARARARAVPG